MSNRVCKSVTRSSYDPVKIIHVWSIEKFSLRKEAFLFSSKFSSNLVPDSFSGFWMKLHPHGATNYPGYLSLYLSKGSFEHRDVINVSFTIQDDKGNVIHYGSSPTFYRISDTSCGLPDFFKRSEILNKLPNDVLKITCELSLQPVETTPSINVEIPAESCCDHSHQLDNFGALLTDDRAFSDITLCVGEERTEFKAHKIILSVSSPYFAAIMDEHEFGEGTENRIEIKDVKPGVFKEILDYIYTRNEPKNLHTESVAKEILVAADKFALDRLKTLAEGTLASKLNIENATELFVLAHKFSAEHLEVAAKPFVTAENLKVVLETPSKGETIAKDIIFAAHSFGLNQPRLNTLAEDFLVSKLRVENASELLILGATHSAETLKIAATDFVAENLKEVMKTQGWREISTQHPHLTNEPILKAIMMRGGSRK